MADLDVPACRVCGCTEDRACPGGCWWVPDPEMEGDLCSECLAGVLEVVGRRGPPNAWAGASVEHDPAARLRIPRLLGVPALRRFLSCEPLLGATRLKPWLGWAPGSDRGVDWVIVGGESGAGRREMDLDAFATIVIDCGDEGTPVWTKQDSGPLPGQQGRIPDDLWVHERPESTAMAAA